MRCQRDDPKCIRNVRIVVVLQVLGDLENLCDPAMHNHGKHSMHILIARHESWAF